MISWGYTARMRLAFFGAAVVSLFFASGCDEFATPAQLETSQIIAVISDPPVVRPGEFATLSAIVAGPDGEVVGLPTRWESVATFNGSLPLGSVVANADGTATYTAPTDLDPDLPPVGTVEVHIDTADGERVAVKAIGIANLAATNPSLDAIVFDGVPASASATLATGQTVELAVNITPEPSDDAIYAWYSTVGEIERYQSSPTSMIASDTATEGWVFAVARDGRGGIAWAKLAVTVQ